MATITELLNVLLGQPTGKFRESVKHYYFYIDDAERGPLYLKV